MIIRFLKWFFGGTKDEEADKDRSKGLEELEARFTEYEKWRDRHGIAKLEEQAAKYRDHLQTLSANARTNTMLAGGLGLLIVTSILTFSINSVSKQTDAIQGEIREILATSRRDARAEIELSLAKAEKTVGRLTDQTLIKEQIVEAAKARVQQDLHRELSSDAALGINLMLTRASLILTEQATHPEQMAGLGLSPEEANSLLYLMGLFTRRYAEELSANKAWADAPGDHLRESLIVVTSGILDMCGNHLALAIERFDVAARLSPGMVDPPVFAIKAINMGSSYQGDNKYSRQAEIRDRCERLRKLLLERRNKNPDERFPEAERTALIYKAVWGSEEQRLQVKKSLFQMEGGLFGADAAKELSSEQISNVMDARTAYMLGQLEWRFDHPDAAIALTRRASALDPEFLQAINARIWYQTHVSVKDETARLRANVVDKEWTDLKEEIDNLRRSKRFKFSPSMTNTAMEAYVVMGGHWCEAYESARTSKKCIKDYFRRQEWGLKRAENVLAGRLPNEDGPSADRLFDCESDSAR